jgi:hypothetical protein
MSKVVDNFLKEGDDEVNITTAMVNITTALETPLVVTEPFSEFVSVVENVKKVSEM